MDPGSINYWAVLVAAFSTFILGAVWYSPALFYKAWLSANHFTEEQVKGFSQARMFGWSFVFALVMAFNLALFLNSPDTDLAWGATAGFLAGFGWVALGLGVVALFEGRSWKYIFINGGYNVVAFTIMGTIIGGWRN
jgi:hypothetical protein